MGTYRHIFLVGFITLCGAGIGSNSQDTEGPEATNSPVSSAEACAATNQCFEVALKDLVNQTTTEEVLDFNKTTIRRLCRDWVKENTTGCVTTNVGPCVEREERLDILRKYSMFNYMCRDKGLEHAKRAYRCYTHAKVKKGLQTCNEDYRNNLDTLERQKQKEQISEDDWRRSVCSNTEEYVACGTKPVMDTCGEETAEHYQGFMKTSLPPEVNYANCETEGRGIDLAIIIIACVIGALILLLLVVCCIVIIYCCGKHHDSSSYVVMNSV